MLRLLSALCVAALSAALWSAGANAQQTVQQVPANVSTLNGSSTITAGNTFQTILAAISPGMPGTVRRSVTIQNNNTNGDNCWLFIGSGSATKGTSILLAPGGSYQRYAPYVPSDAIQATCTTTNDTLYVDTQ